MINTRELRAMMVRNSLTQQDLASKLHMSSRTLNTRLSGQSDFTIREATSLITILHITNPLDIFFAEEVT